MSSFILLTTFLFATDDGWRFVDEPAYAGRSVMTFRTIDLADTPSAPLHGDDRVPKGAKFGSVAIGPGGRRRLGVVWHLETAAVWFDADADGRYAPSERSTLGDKLLSIRIKLPLSADTSEQRTLLIRKRGEGIAYAIRGYTTGAVVLKDKKVAALLTDGNADGCFDAAGQDRIWLDLDADGKFDALTEQFPLGTAINFAATAVLIQPSADGLAVRARQRPNETGALKLQVSRLAQAEVVEVSAQYVSEFGELIVVRHADKPVEVPAGKYRLESLRLKLADTDGQVWRYSFTGDDKAYGVNVAERKETIDAPLTGLKMEVNVEAAARPGESITVRPNVVAGPLYLTSCEVGPRFAETGRESFANITLCEPASAVLDRAASGFH